MGSSKIDKQFFIKVIFIALVALIVYNWSSVALSIGLVWKVIFPIILGGMVAYVLNLLMRQIEKRLFTKTDKRWLGHLRRPLAIILSLLVIGLAITIIVALVVPQLVTAMRTLFEAVPEVAASIEHWVDSQNDLIPMFNDMLEQVDINWGSIVANFAEVANEIVQGLAESSVAFVSSSASAVTSFVLALMFALYILISKEKLGKQFHDLLEAYFSEQHIRLIKNILNITDDVFANFITGTVFEAFILGVIVAIGLWIIQLPYALMLGALQGVLAFIPIVGAFIAGFIGVIIQFAVSPMNALIYLIFVIIIQQLEGDIIYPRVVGDSVGLPGMWVLAAVMVGSGLFGISGMLLGVPITAVLYKIIIFEIAYRREQRQKIETTSSEEVFEEEGIKLKVLDSLRHQHLSKEDIQDI